METDQQENSHITDLVVFSQAKTRLQKLIGQWSQDITDSEVRRDLRYVDIDLDTLRNSGKLAPDSTLIPERIIDTNIAREEPAYVQYLTGSRRLAVFKCTNRPNVDARRIEDDFTTGLTYSGWFREFYRVRDGAAMHGSDALEVVLDMTKPLHVGFEHIGFENFYFNKDVTDIQHSEFVIRRYCVTAIVLEDFVRDHRFDPVQVSNLLTTNVPNQRRDEKYHIYKVYMRIQGIIYVAWFSLQGNCSDWLKAPEMLSLGIMTEGLDESGQPVQVDTPVDRYPIFRFVYKEDEEQQEASKVGRCFLDEYRQEATTAVVSSLVNGVQRASNVYASPEDPDDTEDTLRQTDVKLAGNKIYSKKLEFWGPPYPDATVLQLLNFLGASNTLQAGQVDFAAMNRKDSRKTARELEEASDQADQLKTVGLAFYGEYLRDIFSFAWRIVQSQAIQGLVQFALIEQQQEIGPPVIVNDLELIILEYDVRPSGAIDVIERLEKIAMMERDWPVVQTTPIALPFLADLLKLKYPDDGVRYAQILEAGDPGKALVGALSAALTQLVTPEQVQALDPAQAGQLQNLQSQVQNYMTNGPLGAQ